MLFVFLANQCEIASSTPATYVRPKALISAEVKKSPIKDA